MRHWCSMIHPSILFLAGHNWSGFRTSWSKDVHNYVFFAKTSSVEQTTFLLMFVDVVHFSSWHCCRSHTKSARRLTGISADGYQHVTRCCRMSLSSFLLTTPIGTGYRSHANSTTMLRKADNNKKVNRKKKETPHLAQVQRLCSGTMEAHKWELWRSWSWNATTLNVIGQVGTAPGNKTFYLERRGLP